MLYIRIFANFFYFFRPAISEYEMNPEPMTQTNDKIHQWLTVSFDKMTIEKVEKFCFRRDELEKRTRENTLFPDKKNGRRKFKRNAPSSEMTQMFIKSRKRIENINREWIQRNEYYANNTTMTSQWLWKFISFSFGFPQHELKCHDFSFFFFFL